MGALAEPHSWRGAGRCEMPNGVGERSGGIYEAPRSNREFPSGEAILHLRGIQFPIGAFSKGGDSSVVERLASGLCECESQRDVEPRVVELTIGIRHRAHQMVRLETWHPAQRFVPR